MNRLVIKSIDCNGQRCDVLIEGQRLARIAPVGSDDSRIASAVQEAGVRVINGSGRKLVPPFYNCHTHAAMTLLRGYADDMPLFTWLNEHIWPAEARMTTEMMYHGVRLAMLEMIKSGTVFFNDMYFGWERCMEAVEEMGLRAAVADTLIEARSDERIEGFFEACRRNSRSGCDRIQWTVAPHAIYTVGEKLLRRCADTARELDLRLHIHLSETRQENDDCLSAHGMSPTAWLHHLGVLGPKTVVAHGIWLSDKDMDILRETGTTVVHNPCSNMKLASGAFPAQAAIEKGLHVALGTDGTSSNNNLDMHEEMKTAALLAKLSYGAEALKADEALRWATVCGARAFGIDAGIIEEGRLADALIVNLSNERLVPGYNFVSDWVYSADSRAIDYVICDGRILMENGRVPYEEQIIENARRSAADLLHRIGK
ncbi:MAG: amidohydrolase [Bacteroidales bacterium]|nr:amidohydrolase [Bacteroidales bacterium]